MIHYARLGRGKKTPSPSPIWRLIYSVLRSSLELWDIVNDLRTVTRSVELVNRTYKTDRSSELQQIPNQMRTEYSRTPEVVGSAVSPIVNSILYTGAVY